MGKKRNVPRPGHFRVQGHRVEDSDATRLSKEALDREAARLGRRAAKRPKAPKRRRAPAAPKVEVVVPPSFAQAHDRELMSPRRAPRRVTPPAPAPAAARGRPAEAELPRYLVDTARGVIRRVARVALSPLALARAVVDRFRDRD
jgi:hypothetical protein